MKIEIKDSVKEKNLIEKYKNILNNLDEKIIRLIEEKGITMLLAHSVFDICNEKHLRRIQKGYIEDMSAYPYKGIMTNENIDNKIYIAVFEKHLEINELDNILYHEIGHFLDGFKVIEETNPDLKLFLSGDENFRESYKKDLRDNWDKIKNDKNAKLIHCIQNSTPAKISPTAIVETFAETFAALKNNQNMINLCFPSTKESVRKLLNKTYGLNL